MKLWDRQSIIPATLALLPTVDGYSDSSFRLMASMIKFVRAVSMRLSIFSSGKESKMDLSPFLPLDTPTAMNLLVAEIGRDGLESNVLDRARLNRLLVKPEAPKIR